MLINNKYHIEGKMARLVLANIRKYYLDLIPARDISSLVVVEEFFHGSNLDFDISFQRLYNTSQLDNGQLQGKPIKIYLIKMQHGVILDRHEYVFTNIIEVKKTLKFFEFVPQGLLTQIRTSFLISDDLISIPITISETNELGCFIEIGNVAGPIANINEVLNKFADAAGIQDDWIGYIPYQAMLSQK